MEWNPATSPADLNAAAADFDDYAVGALCDALVSYINDRREPYEREGAIAIMATLRQHRRFAELKRVGGALLDRGQRATTVQRQYGQALIETGDYFAAETVLQGLTREAADVDDTKEAAEAAGLLGRVFKQRYVNTPVDKANAADLTRATKFYFDMYDRNPKENLWHGINAVALLKRGVSDGITMQEVGDADDIAQQILNRIREKRDAGAKPDPWDQAIAMEASLALGKIADSVASMMAYISGIETEQGGLEKADAFMFASTLRQLEQVWRLDGSQPPGSQLLPQLEIVSFRGRDGARRMAIADVAMSMKPQQYEAAFGLDKWFPMQWMRTGLKRATRIVRISRTDTDRTVGTGFLITGSSIGIGSSTDTFLMTNSHVISGLQEVHEDPEFSSVLYPDQATLQLDVLNQRLSCSQILWESKPAHEDTTIVALERSIDLGEDPYPVSTKPIPSGGLGSIFVIGYPEGGTQAMVSFENNRLLEMSESYLRYRTPTAPGSSGSPLFDADWQLVGIHHSTSKGFDSFKEPGKKLAANEGVWIRRIQQAIAQSAIKI